METAFTQPQAKPRTPLAGLGKLLIVELVGVAIILAYLQAMMFGFVLPIAIFALVALGVAGLLTTGWRWVPALAALLSAALLLMFGVPLLESLTHPTVGGPMFIISAILIPLAIAGVLIGIGATVQNYRRAANDRRVPRGLIGALLVVVGLVAGAILVAMAPQPGITAGVSSEDLAKLPALTGKDFMFDQTELHAKAGQTVTLRLENADPEAHYLDIDELNVHAPIAPGKTGLAVFTATQPRTYTFYCHPHADKASGEGMVGKLIVEP